jgi:hypothetical protein
LKGGRVELVREKYNKGLRAVKYKALGEVKHVHVLGAECHNNHVGRGVFDNRESRRAAGRIARYGYLLVGHHAL